MAVAELNIQSEVIGFGGKDSVVIKNYVDGLAGGRSLDVAEFKTNATENVIHAGHVVIYDSVNECYKPMPLASGGKDYGTLPSNCSYVGVTVNTVLVERPMCAIMTMGTIYEGAVPFNMSAIKSAFKTAVPTIVIE